MSEKELKTIDASGRTLGRVASEAAVNLMGKKSRDIRAARLLRFSAESCERFKNSDYAAEAHGDKA